jgi:hypothetical protein
MATNWKFAAVRSRSLPSRAAPFCHSERSEESLVLWSRSVLGQPEMFRFAQFATGRIRRGGHDRLGPICPGSKWKPSCGENPQIVHSTKLGEELNND